MDILFSKITLLVIAILAIAAFLVYSVILSRRIGVVAYFKIIGQSGKVIVLTAQRPLNSHSRIVPVE